MLTVQLVRAPGFHARLLPLGSRGRWLPSTWLVLSRSKRSYSVIPVPFQGSAWRLPPPWRLSRCFAVASWERDAACMVGSTATAATVAAAATISMTMGKLLDKYLGPKGGQLLSTHCWQLSAEERCQAEEAIRSCGGRVTVGDVAAKAGLTLGQARGALQVLAADSHWQATLQVSPEGEILYVFQEDCRGALRSQSLALQLKALGAAVVAAAGYLARIAFGVTHVLSAMVVYLHMKDSALGTAVVVICLCVMIAMMAVNASAVEKHKSSSSSFTLPSINWYHWSSSSSMSSYDFSWEDIESEYQPDEGNTHQSDQINILKAVFSFVFGDGNPNVNYDRLRWKALGQYIQSKGGVVVAEELAPYLDVAPGQVPTGGGLGVDESYVLPALARLGGEPQVDPSGNLLYIFPSLQQTGGASPADALPPTPVLEQPWAMTAASADQQQRVVALGLINLAGLLGLTEGILLLSLGNAPELAQAGMRWVPWGVPLMQAYAATFFLIPACRWVLNVARNSAIKDRNKARQEAAALVQAPDMMLAAKLAAAAALACRTVVTGADAIYRSDRTVEAQSVDLEGELFEKRLARKQQEASIAQA